MSRHSGRASRNGESEAGAAAVSSSTAAADSSLVRVACRPNASPLACMTARLSTLTHCASHHAPCSADFGLEVLKSGTLLETRALTGQPFFTFGRSPTADVLLEHPSASRLHAVLQFKAGAAAAFLCDCGSTHGTFLNRNRLRPRALAPLRCTRQAAAQQAQPDTCWAALHTPDCMQALGHAPRVAANSVAALSLSPPCCIAGVALPLPACLPAGCKQSWRHNPLWPEQPHVCADGAR